MTSPWRRRLPWLVLLLVCLVLFGSTVHNELGDIGGDSATYVLLAKSLATGQGYRDLADPAQRPHVKYPPLFPLMLAPLVSAFGPLTFWPMHALVAAFAVIAILLTVVLVHALDDRMGGWLAGWATAAHPWVLASLLCLWTEFPYLALSLLALFALHRYRTTITMPNRWLWIAAAATAAAALTRVVGWMVVLAGVCSLWPARPWRAPRAWLPLACWLAVTLLPLGAWAARNAAIHDPAGAAYGYWREWQLADPLHPEQGAVDGAGLMRRVCAQTALYTLMIGHALSIGIWPLAGQLLLVAWVLLGWAVAWRRARGVVEWYVAWYLLMLVLHPWNEGGRLLLPILPLLWHYLWVGGGWCVGRVRRPPWSSVVRVGAVAGVALTLAGQAIAAAQVVRFQHTDFRLPPPEVLAREPQRRSMQWSRMNVGIPRQQAALFVAMTDTFELMDWMRRHLTERTVILSRKPSITTLLSGHPSILFPFTMDTAAWRSAMAGGMPVALLADRFGAYSWQYAWPFVEAHADLFEPMHTIGTATLFHVAIERWPASTRSSEQRR